MPRVAWVSVERANPDTPALMALRRGLRELGWVEGKTVVVEPWWAEGSVERLKTQVIPQILASRPDVVVSTSGAVRPLVDAHLAMPLVFSFSGDPAVGGLVQSWAKPGVNRTGVTYFSLELVPKRMDLMRELTPRMKRVAVVGWPPHPGEQLEVQAAAAAAERLGLVHRYFGATSAAEVDAALEAADTWRVDAVLVLGGVVAAAYADRFAAFAARRHIPAVSAWASFAEAGNVMTYGPVLQESQTRLASFVDRILKGEKAADMPVEGPTKLELVLNLKAARAVGLDVPRALLLRADRVIE